MVKKMRAQAARWDAHGRAWVIYRIPNPTRTRQQRSAKRGYMLVNAILHQSVIYRKLASVFWY